MATTPADLTRLMNNARVHLPGALDTVIQYELFNALDEFFQTSKAWQEDIVVHVKSNITDYEVEADDPGVIEGLMWVVDANGVPVPAVMSTLGTVTLNTAPSVAQDYTATVSLTVVDPTTRDGYPQFPDWVLNKYGSAILDGLIGRMMAQPAKPYFNQTLSVYHLRRYRNGIANARTDVTHQNLYRGQTWRFPGIAPARRN